MAMTVKQIKIARQKQALSQYYPPKQLRTMVILKDKDSCISIETVKNDKAEHRWRGSKSTDFWITKEHMQEFFDKGDLCTMNFNHVIRLHKYKEFIEVDIMWLGVNNYNGEVKGHKEHFLLDYGKVYDWFTYTQEEEFRLLNSIEKIITKVEFVDTENLKKVAENKLIRKKFGKKIIWLLDYTSTKVKVSSDFMPYSFYFRKFRNGEYNYNGGLILHKDYKEEGNLAKAYYGIHT